MGDVIGTMIVFETFGKVAGPICVSVGFAKTLAAWGRPGHGVAFACLVGLHLLYSLLAFGLPPCVEAKPVPGENTANKGDSVFPPQTVVGASAVKTSNPSEHELEGATSAK